MVQLNDTGPYSVFEANLSLRTLPAHPPYVAYDPDHYLGGTPPADPSETPDSRPGPLPFTSLEKAARIVGYVSFAEIIVQGTAQTVTDEWLFIDDVDFHRVTILLGIASAAVLSRHIFNGIERAMYFIFGPMDPEDEEF